MGRGGRSGGEGRKKVGKVKQLSDRCGDGSVGLVQQLWPLNPFLDLILLVFIEPHQLFSYSRSD